MRYPALLDDPAFAALRDAPRFGELRARMLASLAADREEILQLVCFDNPTPGHCQPLPETCERINQQR